VGKQAREATRSVEAVDVSAQQAVDLYNEQRDDLYAAGRRESKADGLTVADLCNRFLTSKQGNLDTGEIKFRRGRTTTRFAASSSPYLGATGLWTTSRPTISRRCERNSPGARAVSLAKDVRLARIVFKYGYDALD